MRYPEFLKEGGRVGCVAPSFGATMEPYSTCFEAAVKKIEGMGYKVVKGPNTYRSDGFGKSSTPENCGEEINDFFLNDRSDVILAVGGGETMCEDLPFVDFEGIRKAWDEGSSKAKWYMGYSDNTNLTLLMPTILDTAAVYGPCMPSFGMRSWHEAVKDAWDLITGKNTTLHSYDKWEYDGDGLPPEYDEDPLLPYCLNRENSAALYKGDQKADSLSFSGRLIGGCLDCLTGLCGTRFDRVKEFVKRYEDDGIIWFMEACDLDPMRVRRALWQLDNAGWFDGNIKGFIIGRPRLYYDDFMGMDQKGAVFSVLGKYDLPVIMDADLGHLPPMMPIIEGAVGKVSAASKKEGAQLTIEQVLR